jgi:sulfatase maturation enzyme AslB (radical SAM superfamily)
MEWAGLERLNVSVSIDGLQPEHDLRRAPATYDRILKHIEGHRVTVHCTVTRQQASTPGYLARFVDFWSKQPSTKRIWMSLYTPQAGEVSAERLTMDDRRRAVEELRALRDRYPALDMPVGLINTYLDTPASPADCVFSRVTTSVSADLETRITPCQFGGTPDCVNCRCIASAGLASLGRHRLPGGLRVGSIFEASLRIGAAARWLRGERVDEAAAPPMPRALAR